MCECKRYPGKFEGEGPLTFVVYQMMLLGQTSTFETVDAVPAADLISLDEEMVESLREEGYCDECIKEATEEAYREEHKPTANLTEKSFYCIEESDQGFVDGAWQTLADLEAIADAQAGYDEDEGDEDPDPTAPLVEKPIQLGLYGQIERDSSHRWPTYADGGYPFIYYTKDGSTLCPDCANGENDSEAHESAEEAQWRIIGADVFWEGAPTLCEHCECFWESAYGDPDAESTEDED